MYVHRFITGSTPSILTRWGSFFVCFFFYSEVEKRIIFYDSLIRFCFMSNFRFSKNLLLFCFFFLMIGLEFWSRVGSIRKSIKKTIFKKKNNFSSYRGSFVITKNVFSFKKLTTLKLNGQFFGEKSR